MNGWSSSRAASSTSTPMGADGLEKLLGSFRRSAFRLETRQDYAVAGTEAERLAAWRDHRPLPERSVRTNAYLRDVARAALAGKEFTRLRIVAFPLSEYTLFELAGYAESAAAGERVLLADRSASPDLDLHDDFWLFDDRIAVTLAYTTDGRFAGADLVRDREAVRRLTAIKYMTLGHGVPLNRFLAGLEKQSA
jgi:uncharacterized protein DUF6879